MEWLNACPILKYELSKCSAKTVNAYTTNELPNACSICFELVLGKKKDTFGAYVANGKTHTCFIWVEYNVIKLEC